MLRCAGGANEPLHAMGLLEEHIANLKERNFASRADFLNYALRSSGSSNSDIRLLKMRMKELRGALIGKIVRLKPCCAYEPWSSPLDAGGGRPERAASAIPPPECRLPLLPYA